MRPDDQPPVPTGQSRILRLAGWIAAANAVAIALAAMPVSSEAAGSARALLAFCGIG